MIDLDNLQAYRENNRIEAKKALGGLPESIWETYSAFANAEGGVILLGVVEEKDKSLRAIDLPAPEHLIRRFWAMVTNPAIASANLLQKEDVSIQDIDGRQIVTITVPPAPPELRPVYVDGDVMRGTYRRCGEGDCRCTPDEIRAMQHEAASCRARKASAPTLSGQ